MHTSKQLGMVNQYFVKNTCQDILLLKSNLIIILLFLDPHQENYQGPILI